jgi:hypothetical protein
MLSEIMIQFLIWSLKTALLVSVLYPMLNGWGQDLSEVKLSLRNPISDLLTWLKFTWEFTCRRRKSFSLLINLQSLCLCTVPVHQLWQLYVKHATGADRDSYNQDAWNLIKVDQWGY